VGSPALDLAGSSLFYGVTSATTTAGNFMLLEKGAGNGIFKIDSSGNFGASGYFTNLLNSGLTNMIRNGSLESGLSYWSVGNDIALTVRSIPIPLIPT